MEEERPAPPAIRPSSPPTSQTTTPMSPNRHSSPHFSQQPHAQDFNYFLLLFNNVSDINVEEDFSSFLFLDVKTPST